MIVLVENIDNTVSTYHPKVYLEKRVLKHL